MSAPENRTTNTGRRLASRIISAAALLLGLSLIHLWQTRDLAEGPAPALSGHTLQGEWLDIGKFTERPLLVHFWAGWCPVCKVESGGIESLSKDYPVVTVAMQSGSENDV
ncbi:MAG: thioredoxin domain-containing protein, partial [Candidatus Thiodiazotropha endolucinida]